MFAGLIQLWMMDTLPDGFLLANGSEVFITDYPELYAAIGGIYGPASPGKFRLPDLRGYFPRGYTGVTTVDPDVGTRTARGDGLNGNRVGTTQASGYKSHSHTFSSASGGGGGAAQMFQRQGGFLSYTVGTTGGLETRPKNVYIRPIIKY